jgi:hypothetical protein
MYGMKSNNILGMIAAAVLSVSVTSSGADRFWTTTGATSDSSWSNPDNWVDANEVSGIPLPGTPEGDNAVIDAFDTPTTSIVNYDYNVTSGQFSSVFVEDGYSVIHSGTNAFRSTFLILGDTSGVSPATPTNGTYTQSNGLVSIQQATGFPYPQLILGNTALGTGNYNLSGGTLNSPYALVGAKGDGFFTQTGGTYNAQIQLALGTETGGEGTYTKSGAGSVLNAGDILVGVVGTGTFNHQNGTTVVAEDFNTTLEDESGVIPTSGTIGIGGNGGTGTFNLSGGTVTTKAVTIGQDGTGAFNHTGGTLNAAGAVTIGLSGGTPGTYTLSGGALVADTVRVGFIGGGSFTQTAGTAEIENLFISDRANGGAGSYSLQNGALTVGFLDLGTNGTLQIAAGKTVLVEGDYDNANFGTGNSFNRRPANISGTGTINASGDAVQRLTGDVTNGSTGSPSMNFGIVHVGDAVTKNYQVANGGTTGPSLRGAIQTTANGGNLTDTQLTGSGVTASNFGPIDVGTNSGNRAVTLTGADAGNLSGQKVAIVNNFDNVTGQLLSIEGQVNYYADPVLLFQSGAATLQLVAANHYVLDFGAVAVDSGSYTASFGIQNFLHDSVFQDTLGGSFNTSSVNDFALSEFGSFSGIAAGNESTADPDVTFDSAKPEGTYTDTLFLSPTSTNAQDSTNLTAIQLDVRATVVPEPGATLFLLVGAAGLIARRIRTCKRKEFV